MGIHFPWHKIFECQCIKSYPNPIIKCIIKKLWHCLSVPSSLIKKSNLIWKHVAVLMSGPVSLDLSNVCGPDAKLGCSLCWSHNSPFKILEVLEVHVWEVFWFHLFALDWRRQPAYLCLWDSVSFCLLYLLVQYKLWETLSSSKAMRLRPSDVSTSLQRFCAAWCALRCAGCMGWGFQEALMSASGFPSCHKAGPTTSHLSRKPQCSNRSSEAVSYFFHLPVLCGSQPPGVKPGALFRSQWCTGRWHRAFWRL